MLRIRRLTPLVSLALLAALTLPEGSAAADPPTWGWVVARNPSTADYTPTAKNQGNSYGASNTVHRASTGHYVVTFPHIFNGRGGNILVTALNAAPRYCMVVSWASGPLDITATITCHRFSGTLVDSGFSASFRSGAAFGTGTMAYVWANDPALPDYTPMPNYQFNSTGSSNTIHRINAGGYLVSLPGMDPDHGDIQLTGYAGGVCVIGETSFDAGALVVGVRCLGGDQQFDLTYTKNVALTGVSRAKAAYLYANQPTTASYSPVLAHRYSSTSSAINVKRNAVGTYVVTLGGMPKGGGAQVTSAGVDGGGHICQLTGIRTSGLPQKVGVRCYLPTGALADSRFTLSYTK